MIRKVRLRKDKFKAYCIQDNLSNIILSNIDGNGIAVETPQDPVKVETLLLKICHKKRKDVSSPIMQASRNG